MRGRGLARRPRGAARRQGLQVLLVAVGIVAIIPETAQTWTGAGLARWASLDIGDRDLVVSGEVVDVVAYLAALDGGPRRRATGESRVSVV